MKYSAFIILAITLSTAVVSLSNPLFPASAEETVPTSTPSPFATVTPIPTPVPTAPTDGAAEEAQTGGLFYEVDGDPPPDSDVETLASRLVGIDFGRLTEVTRPAIDPKDTVTEKPATPQTLVLNLFDDAVFTGIVEHVERTSSGHVLWGGLDGMELGTMTLVVNGSVVVGTVRTPAAVYTIRTAGGAYVVRQIDESSLPPLGEPLRGSFPEPDSPPPVRPQVRGPDAPDGTSTPTSTPTPVPTVPTSPSEPVPDETLAGGLFSEVEGVTPPSTGVDTLASRLVEIDFGQLSQVTKSPVGRKDPVTGNPTEPQTLVLNLFDDVVFTGIVEHVEPTASGHALWGRLDGVELGTMTLVVNGKIVVGTVRTPEEVYTVRTLGDGRYVIRQIDESSLPPLGEPLEPPLSPRDAPAQADDVPPDDGTEIDVMVVYTLLAKRREGGRAAIEALIDLFVAETNQAYANSGVIHRIKLVLREEVDYIEDGNSGIDLERLRNGSDGHMDHVHERRDMYGADLVHIVVGRSNVGGQAFLNSDDSSSFDEAFGFGLTASFSGLVFAHELGHNMGLHHDRYSLGVSLTGSNYGYVNQRMFEPGAPGSARWRTIMAYSDQCEEVGGFYCPRVPYFSNPDLTYNGDPLGVPADNPSTSADGPTDAVGTLNARREITANFRRSSSSPTPRVGLTMSPYWLAENGGVSTVTATLHRPSSADTIVAVSALPADAVSMNKNGTLTIPAGRTVSVGTVTITGIDNDDQVGDSIVTISATGANTSSLGVIDPEPVALMIADDETTPVVTLSLSPSEIAEHEGWTFVTAMLDSRSSADTIVSVSAEPAELIEQRGENTLTIPAGQTESIGFGVSLLAVDNDELAEATQTVTVSGTSENPQGVAGPENVTLAIIDDEAPFFPDDSIAYTFTAGIAGGRFLPEAAYGNGKLTYSLSPAPSNDVTFTPEPPARIGIPTSFEAGREISYTLTATDADGDTDTMTISVTVRKGVCPNSAAVSGYSDPGIVHDCEALLASRDTLSVDQSLNWDEDLPIDEWKGVRIADGRVVGLRVSSEGIVGTIPSELGSLANLQSLSLGENRLTGGIPTELGSLANLQSLSLSESLLTGEIPKELGSLANLQVLYLWENQLTGEIPKELGSLPNLHTLDLASNQLTGEIPKELGNLPSLQQRLDLSANRLTGTIPKELGNLSNLQQLYLSNNQLTGEIPKELGNLSNLRWLGLSGNRLTGCVPEALRDVPNNDFARLGLPFCSEHPCVSGGAVADATNEGLVSDCGTLLAAQDTLAGTAALNWSADTPIADWTGVAIGEASGRVTEILLGGMGLNGNIPKQLGSLTTLQSLDLSDNRLTGSIAAELLDLANLQELYLGGNRLTGCVPDGLRDVPNNDIARLGLPFCSEHPCVSGGAVVDATNDGLRSDCETLLAARDALVGTATLNWSADTPIAEWNGVVLGGTHGRVTELLLGGLSLNGGIPMELGSLADLTRLFLGQNQLTGEIPKELGNLSNLQELDLLSNQLSGEIPTELGNLSNLQELDLFNNQLTGEIPKELGNLSNLQELTLWVNQLTGEIPKELGNLSNLTGLWLYGNQLTGNIPTELGNLANLRTLLLGGNQLTGEIPKELGNLANLQELDLLSNQLTGEIPTELGNLSNLQKLNLFSNQLTGEIPKELGNLSNLQVLNLWVNQFTGEMPKELGNLSNLQILWLGWNQLSGEIPTELGNLANLRGLHLWKNQLSGEVPKELASLANLQELWLSDNQLTGTIPTELGNLANLQLLDLSNNRLTGEIPTELGNLSNMKWLWLSNNQLTGEIPTELGRLTRLTRLVLNDNDLVGSIPASLGSLSNLERLRLRNNRLSGCVPPRLRDVPDNDLDQLRLPFCPLSAPEAPSIGSVTSEEDSLTISWTHPLGDGGSDITAYDLRHIETDDDETVDPNWTVVEDVWTSGGDALEYTLTGLTVGTEYDIQVRAVNAVGDGTWSATVTATLTTVSTCAAGVAVPDPTSNPGLVSVCESLLTLRDTLAGSASLNWSSDIPISEWDGIEEDSLEGTPPQVVRLYLGGLGLDGAVPSELSGLTELKELYLQDNDLSGPVPVELGDLSSLTHLHLQNNDLTGGIPAELGDLAVLRELRLDSNDLTGQLPPELGSLIRGHSPLGGRQRPVRLHTG